MSISSRKSVKNLISFVSGIIKRTAKKYEKKVSLLSKYLNDPFITSESKKFTLEIEIRN